jgi:hypothetical protein
VWLANPARGGCTDAETIERLAREVEP